MQEFYSNGKLLLTGEYAILDGAVGLALPTAYGQSLHVTKNNESGITWKSYAVDNSSWFEAEMDVGNLEITHTSNGDVAKTLQKILREAAKQNTEFLRNSQGYSVKTFLNFDRNWGLGSSSTLLNNIAQWAKVDAYTLLWNAFSGSGYDIACAQNDSPILYCLHNERPEIKKVEFNPAFRENLYFIYLNKKQNSREGIARYRNRIFSKNELKDAISDLTNDFLSCTVLSDFERLIVRHETLISGALNLPTAKENLFSDYAGAIKSLGAWGGDFVLATGNDNTPYYFKEKGYDTVIPFSKMIL